MKKLLVLAALALTLVPTSASAWFFFFLPGGATRSISDSITGARGDICVKESAKVGEILTSGAGNTGVIKSLSGTSSICTNPALPIRAEVEFTFLFNSKAGLNLPDDYEPKKLTDFQRYNGTLLMAVSKSKRNTGVIINSRKKTGAADPASLASNVEKNQISLLVDAKSQNAEQIELNGLKTWRFEVVGKTKGLFGQQITYFISTIEGEAEILIVNCFSPSDNFEAEKEGFIKIVAGITGLKAVESKADSQAAAGSNAQPPAQSVTSPDSGRVASTLTKPLVNTAQENTSETKAVADKLKALAQLYKDGLINKQDYEDKKKELLRNF